MTSTQRILARAASALVVGLAALGATTARAADCVGFTDVVDDGPNGFCPSVEWIKNRSVTAGCGAGTTYCPSSSVSRLAMAAFMKRLGEALTPVQLAIDLRPGGVDLDAGTVVCQTPALSVTGFPRTAYADGTIGATATADVNFAADVVVSTDGGTSWSLVNSNANLGSAPANQWGNLSDLGVKNLDVGQNVRFGLQLSRGGLGGTTDLTDSRCQVRVMVYSRTGTTSPL